MWFGEAVPAFEEAIEIVSKADVFAVIGTSLNVYPAAGLVNYVPKDTPLYIVDPNEAPQPHGRKVHFIQEKAGVGVGVLTTILRG